MEKEIDLPERYYSAERFLWLISSLLIFSDLYSSKDTPIKILDFSFGSYQDSARLAVFFIVAILLYLYLEFLSAPVQAKKTRQELRFFIDIILATATIAISYETIFKGTVLSGVPPYWYILLTIESIIFGALFSNVLLCFLMIRSKADSQRLSVPRLPLIALIQIAVWTPVLIGLIYLYKHTIKIAPPQIESIAWIIILIISVKFLVWPVLHFIKGNYVRNSFEWRDYNQVLSKEDSKELNLIAEKPPKEKQAAIIKKIKENRFSEKFCFSVKTLESFSISLPNEKSDIYIKTPNSEKESLKVEVTHYRGSSRPETMELNLKEIELNLVDFLENHSADKKISKKSSIYSLKRATKTKLMKNSPAQYAVEIIQDGNRELISLYLKNESNFNEQKLNGWTPLMMAIAQNDLETAKSLLDLGVWSR